MLTLYRRHTKTCKVHKLNLTKRAKRLFQDCACPIWMCGRTDKQFYKRKSLGLTDWKAAEAERQAKDNQSKDVAIHGPSIKDCVERFTKARTHEIAKATADSYTLLLGKLETFCSARGVHFMHELTTDLLEDFKVDGLTSLADTSKRIATDKLRCFLRVAFRREWIETHLAERVTWHRAVREQKSPYTDKEIESILAEAFKLNGGTYGYAAHPKTFRLLLELMLETGMRVSDAVRFDPAAIRKGDSLWIYTYAQRKTKRTKTPEQTEAYLTDRLKIAIDKCDWLSPKRPFWFGSEVREYRMGKEVYERMHKIGERCGVTDCRPHRLRDTFAARALVRGIPIGDVSRLLGHSSVQVTETYYAKWIPPRARRLEGLVAQSLVNA
jgi:integrase